MPESRPFVHANCFNTFNTSEVLGSARIDSRARPRDAALRWQYELRGGARGRRDHRAGCRLRRSSTRPGIGKRIWVATDQTLVAEHPRALGPHPGAALFRASL